MSLTELKTALSELPPDEFAELMAWAAEQQADAWDAQIEADADAGRFDALRQRVRAQRDAGECRPL